jgi:nucleotide-binding universal stress UspA family protein
MQTILCPFDFSENARQGIAYAVAFAKIVNARLLLVYFEPIPYLDPDTFIAEPMVASLEEARKQLADLSVQLSADVPCDYLAQAGSAPDMIVATARERHADWILMTTKGAGNKPEALVGSVAAEVAANTPCPVLIVPQGFPFKPIDKIVLAADLQATDRRLLTPLIGLAKTTHAQVTALHVETEGSGLDEKRAVEAVRLEEWLGDVPASVHILAHENVQEGVDEFANQQGAGLVAVIARKHGFFASLFHRSVTRLVTIYTTVPLMVIPEQV